LRTTSDETIITLTKTIRKTMRVRWTTLLIALFMTISPNYSGGSAFEVDLICDSKQNEAEYNYFHRE